MRTCSKKSHRLRVYVFKYLFLFISQSFSFGCHFFCSVVALLRFFSIRNNLCVETLHMYTDSLARLYSLTADFSCALFAKFSTISNDFDFGKPHFTLGRSFSICSSCKFVNDLCAHLWIYVCYFGLHILFLDECGVQT